MPSAAGALSLWHECQVALSEAALAALPEAPSVQLACRAFSGFGLHCGARRLLERAHLARRAALWLGEGQQTLWALVLVVLVEPLVAAYRALFLDFGIGGTGARPKGCGSHLATGVLTQGPAAA